eukprot:4667774-Prorocentrum_lima.AAC.1
MEVSSGGSRNPQDKVIHILSMGSHEGVDKIHLRSGEEGGVRREGDGGGASKTGEPVHNMDEESMHD